MERGAWQARVHGVAEDLATEHNNSSSCYSRHFVKLFIFIMSFFTRTCHVNTVVILTVEISDQAQRA